MRVAAPKAASWERLAPGKSTDALAARVCWHHYKEGLTQQEIADRVGLSRATINKIISEARAAGLVRTTIDSPLSPCLGLETELKQAFGLQDVVVVPAPNDERDAYLVVGQAAGDYVSSELGRNEVLGLTWGSTVHFAAQAIQPRKDFGNTVVSLSGGLARSTIINPYDNASMVARALDADCHYITAPLIAESRPVKDALLSCAPVSATLAMADEIDMALLTAVDLSAGSKIMEYGVLTEEMRKSLLKAGSVGNVCDHYIDRDGGLVDHPINDCTVSAPLDTVMGIPRRVLAGGGTYKTDILLACLKAQICTVLITEERAAHSLLEAGTS